MPAAMLGSASRGLSRSGSKGESRRPVSWAQRSSHGYRRYSHDEGASRLSTMFMAGDAVRYLVAWYPRKHSSPGGSSGEAEQA